jgi:four helix bundle protein
MATNFSYRDLRIWQEAVALALVIYRATAEFPKHELYGLTSQMRRAAVSISSNIAEGKGHSSDGDFGRFLFHARGSLLELQTQIVIARGLEYFDEGTSCGAHAQHRRSWPRIKWSDTSGPGKTLPFENCGE